MNFLSFVSFLFFLFFVCLFIYRLRSKKDGVKTVAKLISVEEGIIESPQLYNTIRYFYPLLTYQYDVDGEVIIGKVSKKNSREYRIPEYDGFGSKNNSDKFFWRNLSIGDELDIFFSKKNIEKSWLAKERTSVYRSETSVLLFVSVLFALITIASTFFNK